MELIVIIIISIVFAVIISIVFNIDIKKIKEIGMEEKLNKLTEKYPENVEICKDILKKLKNEDVKIEEDKEASTTLYIAVTNKIFIADTKNSYTRIQTMAHECLHSIQDRKLLMFNFIFSNIYIMYFTAIIILTLFKVTTSSLLYLNIFLLLSMVYYMVRIFLENDAMIRAEYVAKEYIEEQQISTKEEIQKICKGFSDINKEGIKGTNGSIFIKIMIKVMIFNVLALIF